MKARNSKAVLGCLLLASAGQSASGDVVNFTGGYQETFLQTGPGELTQYAAAFDFGLYAQPGDVGAAHLLCDATGVSYDLVELTDFPGDFRGGFVYLTDAELDALFPTGTYQMSIEGGALGDQSAQLTLPTPTPFPDAIPTFDEAQFPEYQSIDGQLDYTFRFNTFTPTGTYDSVWLTISAYPSTSRIYFGDAGAWGTELTLPAGTIRNNRRYYLDLYFVSYVSTPDSGFLGAEMATHAVRATSTVIRTVGDCPPDFNGDGALDFFDYDDFVVAFESGDPYADYNSDGAIDFFDYDDFVVAFETGC